MAASGSGAGPNGASYRAWHMVPAMLHLLANVAGGLIAYGTGPQSPRSFELVVWQFYPQPPGTPPAAKKHVSYLFDFFWPLLALPVVSMLGHATEAFMASRLDQVPSDGRGGRGGAMRRMPVSTADAPATVSLYKRWMESARNPVRAIVLGVTRPMLVLVLARLSGIWGSELLATLFFLAFAAATAGYWHESVSRPADSGNEFRDGGLVPLGVGFVCTVVVWIVPLVYLVRASELVDAAGWMVAFFVVSAGGLTAGALLPALRELLGPARYWDYEKASIVFEFVFQTAAFWLAVGGLAA